MTGFFHDREIPQWRLPPRVAIYGTHVHHRNPRKFQLAVFTPDDGNFEYSAVVINLALALRL